MGFIIDSDGVGAWNETPELGLFPGSSCYSLQHVVPDSLNHPVVNCEANGKEQGALDEHGQQLGRGLVQLKGFVRVVHSIGFQEAQQCLILGQFNQAVAKAKLWEQKEHMP